MCERRKGWARAEVVAEAAYLIPLTVTVIVLLMGFTFFLHQRVTSLAMAGESAMYGLSRQAYPDKTAEELARERADRLITERVLDNGAMTAEASLSPLYLTVSFRLEVLPELFGSLFRTEGALRAARIKPVAAVQTKWILTYVSGGKS